MPLLGRRVVAILMITTVAAWAAPSFAAGDPAQGKVLSYTCLGCHGIEGYKNMYPTYSVPKLRGQHPEYLIAALKEYRSGERSHATMHQQAASLSDQDIEDIASYFAGAPLKPGAPAVGTPPPKVAQLCVACHGKEGVGIMGDYPTLAGQHADYIARALEEYQKGDRKNAVMPSFMTGVTPQEIREIADYYSQQKPELQTEPRRLTILSAE
ncbi:MAG TPA: cytochrome c [Steroidobacteraceae bacterium]|jgi:cytochrome c553